jgi:hypothetical protein
MCFKLPDSIQDKYKAAYDSAANAKVLTFLKRELVHAIWSLLLTDDFVNAYVFGIVVLCADGVNRRLFPRLFTYSADYPEKCVHSIYVALYLINFGQSYSRHHQIPRTLPVSALCMPQGENTRVGYKSGQYSTKQYPGGLQKATRNG